MKCFLPSTLHTVPIRSRSLHRVPGPGWQFDAFIFCSSFLERWTLPSSLAPSPSVWHTCLHLQLRRRLWTLTLDSNWILEKLTFLTVISLGEVRSGHFFSPPQQIQYRSMEALPFLLPPESNVRIIYFCSSHWSCLCQAWSDRLFVFTPGRIHLTLFSKPMRWTCINL